MPTVLRVEGLRFVVYPSDHLPAHVHLLGPGWVVVVNLHGPEVREVVGHARGAAGGLEAISWLI